MRRALGWIALMVCVALAASWAEARLAAATEFFRDPSGGYDVAYAFTLPIRLVQGAYPGWPILAVLWAMFAVIGWAGWNAARAFGAGLRPAFVVAGFLAVAAAFTTFATVHSGDVYYYVLYGRLYGLHDLNPYALGASPAAESDPIVSQIAGYTKNPPYPDPYGPLWTLLSGGIARIEQGLDLGWQAWSYRALAIVAAALCLAALLHMLRNEAAGERSRRAALFAFHPLVLYETAVGGHTEIVMMAPAMWAFALVEELPLLAGLLLGASIAIKYVSALALPFLVLRAWRQSAISGVLCGLIAIAMPVLLFQPFWVGASTMHAAAGNINVLAVSPTWLLSLPLLHNGGSAPAFGGVLSLPVLGAITWLRLIQLVVVGAFALVAAWSVVRFARDCRMEHLWRTVTAFIWASPIVHPWYLLWIAPAVAGRSRWATYAWWFAALIPLRYGLEGTAVHPLALLVTLTIVVFVGPVAIALAIGSRDRRLAPAEASR